MSQDLASRSCTPCKGGIPPMPADEAKRMLEKTPGWELKDDATRLERTYKFKNFKQAWGFVDKVGEAAEGEGHHPDITFGWGFATVSWQTHKIDGLHENDFIMAARCNEFADAA